MFADPQSITVNAVAQSMPRISSTGTKSTYRKSDGTYQLTISHSESNNRVRSMARVDNKAIVTNPLDSTNDFDTLSFYVVVDRPVFGFTQTQVDQLIAGFKTWLDSAAITKLFAQES